VRRRRLHNTVDTGWVVAVRLLHGHERGNEHAKVALDAPSVLTVSERYSVDELHAVARRSGREGFPGVPLDTQPSLSPRERASVDEALIRSLVARGVISAATRTPIAPHVTLFAVVLDPEVTCSVQRYRPGELSSRNVFLLEGLLVDETSPSTDVVELAARDAQQFDHWVADATGWAPAPTMLTEVRQITRRAHKIRSLFGALAADVPTTLEDQRVVDAGRVVTYRRSGSAVDGVDLAWITTEDTVWVFPHASDLLTGFGRGDADVTLQATTEAELTRALRRSIRPVALRS
jgi:hypothetical protein